jgi:hypothetical protein
MLNRLPKILVVFFLLEFGFGMGQTVMFQKMYTSDTTLVFRDIIQTSDRGYIICGKNDANDHILIKADSLGNIIWSKKLGDLITWEESVRVGSNGTNGYYVFGLKAAQFNLVVTDLSGNILWSKIYYLTATFSSGALYPSIKRTQNGEFVISGTTIDSIQNPSYTIIKTNSTGDILWSRRLVPFSGQKLYCFDVDVNINQNAYTISAKVGIGAGLYAASFDVNGNLLWANYYTNLGNSVMPGNSITRTSDGGYAICSMYAPGMNLPMMTKIDAGGNVLWTKYYTNPLITSFVGAQGICQTNDGGFVFADYKYHGTTFKPFLLKTNSSGVFQWAKFYSAGVEISYNFPFLHVSQTRDKGYVFCTGSIDSITYTKNSGWIIKTDSLGNTGCNDSTLNFSTNSVILNTQPTDSLLPGVLCSSAILSFSSLPISYSTSCGMNFEVGAATNIDPKNNINFFPNPSSGKFTLKNSGEKINKLELYNIEGEKVKEIKIAEEKNKWSFDISNEPNGVYFLKIYSEKETHYTKIIKE